MNKFIKKTLCKKQLDLAKGASVPPPKPAYLPHDATFSTPPRQLPLPQTQPVIVTQPAPTPTPTTTTPKTQY